METACDVYTKLLFQRGYGHPLWEPEPTAAGEVLIGDVGYISDGGFYRLFNATLPPDHPVNKSYGVPAGYVPFTFPKPLYQCRPQALAPGPLCSRNVRATSVGGSMAVGTSLGGRFHFECADDQAAVLILKHGGNRETLHACHSVTQYILCNHQSWYQFARDVFMLNIKEEDLIFVRGFVKTGEWAVAAATHSAKDGEIVFSGDFGSLAHASFTIAARRQAYMSVEHRTGPTLSHGQPVAGEDSENQSEHPQFDQCAFLHYYKLKRRVLLGPKVMQAAAGDRSYPTAEHDADAGESSSGDSTADDENGAEIEEIPHMHRAVYDPVDKLLNRILQEEGVRCALISDEDVALASQFFPDFLDAVSPPIRRDRLHVDGNGVGMFPVHVRTVEQATLGDISESRPHALPRPPLNAPPLTLFRTPEGSSTTTRHGGRTSSALPSRTPSTGSFYDSQPRYTGYCGSSSSAGLHTPRKSLAIPSESRYRSISRFATGAQNEPTPRTARLGPSTASSRDAHCQAAATRCKWATCRMSITDSTPHGIDQHLTRYHGVPATRTGNRHICQWGNSPCGVVADTHGMGKHIVEHHLNGRSCHHCPFCGANFARADFLSRHITSFCPVNG